jgi:hypothetical protein
VHYGTYNTESNHIHINDHHYLQIIILQIITNYHHFYLNSLSNIYVSIQMKIQANWQSVSSIANLLVNLQTRLGKLQTGLGRFKTLNLGQLAIG